MIDALKQHWPEYLIEAACLGIFMISACTFGVLFEYPSSPVHPNHSVAVAFVAETIITFIQMAVVLNVSNRVNISRYTGLFAGALVATYISIEAPFSGMSMNPARSFGSAAVAQTCQAWRILWIYFIAPPLGMLLAAEVYLRLT